MTKTLNKKYYLAILEKKPLKSLHPDKMRITSKIQRDFSCLEVHLSCKFHDQWLLCKVANRQILFHIIPRSIFTVLLLCVLCCVKLRLSILIKEFHDDDDDDDILYDRQRPGKT